MTASKGLRRLNDAQRLAWLRLIRSQKIGPATSRALINQFGGSLAAIEAVPNYCDAAARRHSVRSGRTHRDGQRETG
ncbi:MAG: hypothetical protein ACTSYK_04840 [Alphaproteobacteria bacterium]